MYFTLIWVFFWGLTFGLALSKQNNNGEHWVGVLIMTGILWPWYLYRILKWN